MPEVFLWQQVSLPCLPQEQPPNMGGQGSQDSSHHWKTWVGDQCLSLPILCLDDPSRAPITSRKEPIGCSPRAPSGNCPISWLFFLPCLMFPTASFASWNYLPNKPAGSQCPLLVDPKLRLPVLQFSSLIKGCYFEWSRCFHSVYTIGCFTADSYKLGKTLLHSWKAYT